MARTFKISFPLPGRRPSSSPNTTPGSQLSASHSDHNDSPLYHPSPKVQEVLGAATPDSNASSKRKSRKERRNLRKLPSFMSVTLADPDENESAKVEEGFPFPGMQTPSMLSANNASLSSRPPSHAMSRHGSSPLLGEHPAIGSTTTHADYFSVENTGPRPQPRQATSLSALRSYYDKAKSPLSVSQQSSDFTTGDMAIQQGEPQISRSIKTDHVVLRTHSRNQSGTSKGSNGSNTSARTKIAGTPRRRPSVNDPPTLHPNAPKVFAHAVSPPPALINSSLPRSIQTGQASSLSFGKPRWWERKKPKMSPPVEMPERFDHVPFEDGISSAKVNVKKPKKGISNWFDAVETDESSLSHYSEPETADHEPRSEVKPQPEGSQNPVTIHEIMAQTPLHPAPAISSRKSSFSNKNKRAGQSDRKLSFKLDSYSSDLRQAGESTQMRDLTRTSLTKSAPGSPTGRNSRTICGPRGISMKDIDLQIQSVLNLSSSEDEEEAKAETSAPESSYRRHRIRPSLERAEYGDEVLLGNALRVQPLKPKPVVNRQSERASYRRSQTTSNIPPVPRLPSRPQLTQRTSSTRWRTLLEEKATSTTSQTQNSSTNLADASESTIDSAGESSLNDNTPPSSQSPPATRLGSNKRSSNLNPLHRGSKLMSVTSEEETLLEAMREKRASIRATDFQKGFNSAMQLHVADYMNRPKTSGADGRTSRSSIYGAGSSRGSISPPLLGPSVYRPPGGNGQYPQQYQQQRRNPEQIGHLYKASLGAQSGLSASTDNLTLEDAYPFPEVPSEPIPLAITRSPVYKSEESPSLTFSSSEVMPSTPSTHNSPLTPPPIGIKMGSLMGAYGVARGGGQISPPRGQQLEVKAAGPGQYGHERRETGSSSVVMLDGTESYAAKLDEENEISGWAVDSGMDRW